MVNNKLVFAYGTLRKGLHNHHYLESSKFITKTKISKESNLKMVCRGHNFSFPYLIKTNSSPQEITGEVYEINQETSKQLDILEGYPSHYTKEKIEVSIKGKPKEVWIYLSADKINKNEQTTIENGDWKATGTIKHR